jgi:hypothetical protein
MAGTTCMGQELVGAGVEKNSPGKRKRNENGEPAPVDSNPNDTEFESQAMMLIPSLRSNKARQHAFVAPKIGNYMHTSIASVKASNEMDWHTSEDQQSEHSFSNAGSCVATAKATRVNLAGNKTAGIVSDNAQINFLNKVSTVCAMSELKGATTSKRASPIVISTLKHDDPKVGMLTRSIEDNRSLDAAGKEGVIDTASVDLPECRKTSLNHFRAEAKTKLRIALLAKKQALEEAREGIVLQQGSKRVRRKFQQTLRPINALLKGGNASLLIRNISTSGPAKLVRFSDCTMPDLETDDIDIEKKQISSALPSSLSSPPLQRRMDLLKRKIELQKRLVEAKDRAKLLEQNQIDASKSVVPSTVNDEMNKPSRLELLERKKNAERKRVRAQTAHLLLKQKHLLEEQDVQIEQTKLSVEDYNNEITTMKAELAASALHVEDLTMRRRVLRELKGKAVAKQIQFRQQLHELRQKINNDGREIAPAPT